MVFSGTPPLGPVKVSLLEGWPQFMRGEFVLKSICFGIFQVAWIQLGGGHISGVLIRGVPLYATGRSHMHSLVWSIMNSNTKFGSHVLPDWHIMAFTYVNHCPNCTRISSHLRYLGIQMGILVQYSIRPIFQESPNNRYVGTNHFCPL